MKLLPMLSSFALLSCIACSGEQASPDITPPDTTPPDTTIPDITSPDMTNEELEALYMNRFNALQDRTSRNGLPAYDTLEPIEGVSNWKPIPTVSQEDRRISEQAFSEARDYAAANNSSSLIVWSNGAIEASEYFGETTPDSLIVSKSLAKPLSVIAVGRAIAEGHIKSLDQSASDFILEWQHNEKAEITIRHLLGMRSGLLPQGAAPEPENILNRAYLHPAHDDVIINDYPLTHKPGERYEYSNANSELVAPLIERATGIPYEEWLTNEVLKPLGAKGGEIWMNRPGGTPHSGCCILLPADSFLRLGVLLIEDGVWEGERLLPVGYIDEMRRTTPSNPHAGLGVYVGSPFTERRGAMNPEKLFGRTYHSEPYLADDLFLFDGNSNQVLYIVPSKRLIIFRTGAWAPKDPEWDNAKLPNILLRGMDESSSQ